MFIKFASHGHQPELRAGETILEIPRPHINNRMFFDMFLSGKMLRATNEFHEWYVENEVVFRIVCVDSPRVIEPNNGFFGISPPDWRSFPRWYLIFANEEDATLFKLTWL